MFLIVLFLKFAWIVVDLNMEHISQKQDSQCNAWFDQELDLLIEGCWVCNIVHSPIRSFKGIAGVF